MIFSIITVTYNAENMIEKTIKSVLEQTNSNFEYIIKDGNSTDATNQIVNSYHQVFEEKKISMKHIVASDGGIYNAMNEAIQECSGEWVIFLNAGDVFFSRDIMQVFFMYIEKNTEADILYGDSISIYNKKKRKCIHESLKLYERMSLCHQGCCIRLEVMKDKLYNEKYKIGADYDFFLKVLLQGYKYIKVPFVVCEYDKSGISSTKLVDSYKEFLEIKKSHGLKIPNKFCVLIKLIIKHIRQALHIL